MSSRVPARETEARPRYGVVIEKARNNYSAYVPDLPGCVATGASVPETRKLIREAIDFHLEGMREDGLPTPEPQMVAIGQEGEGARKRAQTEGKTG